LNPWLKNEVFSIRPESNMEVENIPKKILKIMLISVKTSEFELVDIKYTGELCDKAETNIYYC